MRPAQSLCRGRQRKSTCCLFAGQCSALGDPGAMTANVGKTTAFHGREPITIWRQGQRVSPRQGCLAPLMREPLEIFSKWVELMISSAPAREQRPGSVVAQIIAQVAGLLLARQPPRRSHEDHLP